MPGSPKFIAASQGKEKRKRYKAGEEESKH